MPRVATSSHLSNIGTFSSTSSTFTRRHPYWPRYPTSPLSSALIKMTSSPKAPAGKSRSMISRKMSKFSSAIGSSGSSISSRSKRAISSSMPSAKAQAAMKRRQQRKQSMVDFKNMNKRISKDITDTTDNATARPTRTGPSTKVSAYVTTAASQDDPYFTDPAIDALTIPTASSSGSHDSQSSQSSKASTGSLNALARENTPIKSRTPTKKTRNGILVANSVAATPGNKTPQKVSTTISANRPISFDDEEKDDCKEMFTPIVPRKKGRPPKRMPLVDSNNNNNGNGNINGKVGRSKVEKYSPVEEMLRKAVAKNEQMRRKKDRQERYQALAQLMQQSESTIKAGNTSASASASASTARTASNGTPYIKPDRSLSLTYSSGSDITYESAISKGSNNTNSTGSNSTQPLYHSQSLNVLDSDRVRYVHFTDDVTTFDEDESSYVQIHHVQSTEEGRSEFEVELERKMVEHKIEVKRVGQDNQGIGNATISRQLNTNEDALKKEANLEVSPTFKHPLSPDEAILNGVFTLCIDDKEVAYGNKASSPTSAVSNVKKTTFVQDKAVLGPKEGVMELEAPEAVHMANIIRKPTLSFGSVAAMSDVTGNTNKVGNTSAYGTFDAGDEQYARATHIFKAHPAHTNSNNNNSQAPKAMTNTTSFVSRLQQKLKDCVQPSQAQILDSPPPVRMAPPAGIGGRLRDCIAPRKEFMVHSPYTNNNKGMMSI